VLAGFFTWLLVLLAVAAFEQTPLETILRSLHGAAIRPDSSEVTAAVLVAAGPVLAGIAVALLVAFFLHLLRTLLYARAVHAHSRQYLARHGILQRYGVAPGVVRFTSEGEPAIAGSEPLGVVAEAHPRLLLLGERGAGKTVALYELAYEMTRRRWWLASVPGRRPLPVLLTLPGLPAPATHGRHDTSLADAVAAQVARFSSSRFAHRSMAALRAGKLILLCDQLDAVGVGQRNNLCAELVALSSPGKAPVRMVIACDVQAYTRAPQTFAPLRGFQRVVMAEVTEGEAEAALRRATRTASKGKTGGLALMEHRLDTSRTNPAMLAALLEMVAAGWPLPYGRGPLLIEYIALLCERAAKQEPTVDGGRLGVLLSRLAGSLSDAGARGIALKDTSRNADGGGAAVGSWLAGHEPISVNEHRSAVLNPYPPAETESLCRAAVRAGILDVRSDGKALEFAHRLLEDGFAAWWLQQDDDGLGRIQAGLLRPRWTLPVVLWSDSAKDAADVAKRLLRLADTPDSTAARAGLTGSASVYPAVLALALAAAIESFANKLAQPADTPKLTTRTRDLAQQHLRDLLDRAAIYGAESDQQARLARALQQVEEAVGRELAASIGYLTKQPELNRLLRAQLLGMLGILASPSSLTALAGFLREMDPVLRQATDQAFRHAGGAALDPLQTALAGGGETVRTRAGEVLAGLGEIAVDNALAGLASTVAGERAASARALGLLHASQAADALIARLGDTESAVRVAAARALGEIGTRQAGEALTKAAHSGDTALRAAAARALGIHRDAKSVPILLELLGDADAEVRTAAADALGKQGDDRAVEPLRARRDDPDPWVQHAAVAALRRLGRG
jgi:HEAT repeat protein